MSGWFDDATPTETDPFDIDTGHTTPPVSTNGHHTNGHRPKKDRDTTAPLPSDTDAELALLGCAMQGATDTLAAVPLDAFYAPAHQHIATAILETTAGHPPEFGLILAWLRTRDLLDHIGGAGYLGQLLQHAPSPAAAPSYAAVILDHHRARQIIYATAEAAQLAREGRPAAALVDLTRRLDTITKLGTGHEPDPDYDQFLDQIDDDYDWIVPGLLEHRDRVILTATEGTGKSTLLRQIAVQLASGYAPFTLDRIDPLRVLYVDCENSPRQARRALITLRGAAGGHYAPGHLRLRVLGEAMSLADPAIEADLAARILDHQADVVIIGPLYKLITDDPIKEQPAKAVADAIDRLRNLRGSAFLIEAHSPYAEGSNPKNRPIRPYGASLWSRWPEFGLHLDQTGELKHWRGQREQRIWPRKLQHDQPWPWGLAPDQPTDTWDGPTECMDAIVTFLEDTGGTFSVAQIEKHLRERGRGYRTKTIGDAARLAHEHDRIERTTGPRGALLYSARTLTDQPFEEF